MSRTTLKVVAVENEEGIFRSPDLNSILAEALKFFTDRPLLGFKELPAQRGAGVYAIYYCGNSPLYPEVPATGGSEVRPIYVGKAVPSGWRTARSAETEPGLIVTKRLQEHAKNIALAQNLTIENFRCRYIVLRNSEADLISACEAFLIRAYLPIWNAVIDGFGNHDPGKGRYNQQKSDWDHLHPGRAWAEKLKACPNSREQIISFVVKHLLEQKPFSLVTSKE